RHSGGGKRPLRRGDDRGLSGIRVPESQRLTVPQNQDGRPQDRREVVSPGSERRKILPLPRTLDRGEPRSVATAGGMRGGNRRVIAGGGGHRQRGERTRWRTDGRTGPGGYSPNR